MLLFSAAEEQKSSYILPYLHPKQHLSFPVKLTQFIQVFQPVCLSTSHQSNLEMRLFMLSRFWNFSDCSARFWNLTDLDTVAMSSFPLSYFIEHNVLNNYKFNVFYMSISKNVINTFRVIQY